MLFPSPLSGRNVMADQCIYKRDEHISVQERLNSLSRTLYSRKCQKIKIESSCECLSKATTPLSNALFNIYWAVESVADILSKWSKDYERLRKILKYAFSPWHVCKYPRTFLWWYSWSRWSHSVAGGPQAGRTWLQTGAAKETERRLRDEVIGSCKAMDSKTD